MKGMKYICKGAVLSGYLSLPFLSRNLLPFRSAATGASDLSSIRSGPFVPRHELVDFEFALAPRIVHVANLAKDGPLFPPHVVNAYDRPADAHEAIRIVAVIRVSVIEVLR